MSLQAAVDRYVDGMKSIDSLRKSYGEYGRGRLAIRLLRQHVEGLPLDPAETTLAIGSGEFARDRGNPGHIAAVRPAIVLGSISSFEGFVEDFLAEALWANKFTLAQVAKELGGNNLNNPAIEAWENLVRKYFTPISVAGFNVTVDRYTTTTNFYSTDSLNWNDAKRAGGGWMSVRHIITHGGATGLAAEQWPPPMRAGDIPAADVLKPETNGRHTLRFRSAIGAARIHVHCARYLADQVAQTLNTVLDWSGMPGSFSGPNPP